MLILYLFLFEGDFFSNSFFYFYFTFLNPRTVWSVLAAMRSISSSATLFLHTNLTLYITFRREISYNLCSSDRLKVAMYVMLNCRTFYAIYLKQFSNLSELKCEHQFITRSFLLAFAEWRHKFFLVAAYHVSRYFYQCLSEGDWLFQFENHCANFNSFGKSSTTFPHN